MSQTAAEEVSVLSSIYCREGEFRVVQQSARDGLVVQISCRGGEGGLTVSVVFHLPPSYPSCPPDISLSSPGLSRSQCDGLRQKLVDRAAVLPPEPMLLQLLDDLQLQCVRLTDKLGGGDEAVKTSKEEVEWTVVLTLKHIRSQHRYVGLLERWSQQLQLAGRLLLGQDILLILQGPRHSIKEFCCRLKTVSVDVDSSGKKCKERMMKVLLEIPSASTFKHSLQGFVVSRYQSSSELTSVLLELNMAELHQQLDQLIH